MHHLSFIALKPRKGKTEELLALVRRSVMLLQDLNISVRGNHLVTVSEDGTILHIFEWVNHEGRQSAAEHQEIRELWAEAERLSEFIKPSDIKEFKEIFPSLPLIN